MRSVRTEIEIEAPRARVWEVLTDFARYAEWNPLVHSISAKAEPGAAVDFQVQIGRLKLPIQARMLRVEPLHDLRWRGPRSASQAKLFSGEHYFSIEPLRSEAGGERCVFVHGEQFRGALLPVLWPALEPQLMRGYSAMNEAIKRRAESAS